VRGADAVKTEIIDVNDTEKAQGLAARAAEALGPLDVVLVAHGTLPDQAACAADAECALAEIGTNALSVVAVVTPVANAFEARKSGVIAVISSVAGDRGRQSNYVYGAAKALVTVFLSGLRQRLAKSGVRVVTVKPGFVDTPMTKDFKKGLLWARPADIAPTILRALDKGNGEVYVPWFWRFIMLVIRHVPDAIFRRLKL